MFIMTLQKCVCDYDICNPDYKIKDDRIKNQWNINDMELSLILMRN